MAKQNEHEDVLYDDNMKYVGGFKRREMASSGPVVGTTYRVKIVSRAGMRVVKGPFGSLPYSSMLDLAKDWKFA